MANSIFADMLNANGRRGHQSLDYRTLDEVYFGARAGELATA